MSKDRGGKSAVIEKFSKFFSEKGRRNLIEATTLSVGFHAICVFFIVARPPSLDSKLAERNLHFRFQEVPAHFNQGNSSSTAKIRAPQYLAMREIPQDWNSESREMKVGHAAFDSFQSEAMRGESILADLCFGKAFDEKEKSALAASSEQFFANLIQNSPAPRHQEPRASQTFAHYCASLQGEAMQNPEACPGPAVDELKGVLELSKLDALADLDPKKKLLALDNFQTTRTEWMSPVAEPNLGNEFASNENFQVKTKFYRRLADSDLVFETSYQPKSDTAFAPLGQNFIFYIDQSSVIGSQRFANFKQAVIEALDTLQRDDRFNIVFFNKKAMSFSPQSAVATEENVAAAKSFIQKQKCGRTYTYSDFYACLDHLPVPKLEEGEVGSALLLTNGESRLGRDRQRRSIANFKEKNEGRVSLFVFAEDRGENLPTLEVLAHFNKGQLHCLSQDLLLSQQLIEQIDSLRFAIGKEMCATMICLQKSGAKLLPSSGVLSNFNPKIEFRVMGNCSETDKFYLYLQGRHGSQWLDIKCCIDEDRSIEQPNVDVERRYVILQAFEHYGNYLKSADLNELRTAHELLSKLGYPVAFS